MTKARNVEARYHRFAVPLVLAICTLLALLCWMAASGGGTAVAARKNPAGSPNAPVGMQALTAFWVEDFSAPISSTTYYTTATADSAIVSDGSFLLTQNATNQRGRIFNRSLAPMNEFTATFGLYLGDHDGADGAAFIFCPVYTYTSRTDGEYLDADCTGGYIVAFDTWGQTLDQIYVARDGVDDPAHRRHPC